MQNRFFKQFSANFHTQIKLWIRFRCLQIKAEDIVVNNNFNAVVKCW